jgi:hypothetical protein
MSNLTSVAALVFAVGTGSYSLWANATHDARAKHDRGLDDLERSLGYFPGWNQTTR